MKTTPHVFCGRDKPLGSGIKKPGSCKGSRAVLCAPLIEGVQTSTCGRCPKGEGCQKIGA